MKLINCQTKEAIEAEIALVGESEFKTIKEGKRFDFDWGLENQYAVYKITFKGTKKILGLISLIDFPKEYRIHVNLIESAKENQGKDKIVDRIPGCLLAFAARKSFEKGYQGFISLTPKTRLIDYYTEKYGFSQYGRNLAIDGKEAMALIKKHLES